MTAKNAKAIAYRKSIVAKFEADAVTGKFLYNDPVYHAQNIEEIKAQIAALKG